MQHTGVSTQRILLEFMVPREMCEELSDKAFGLAKSDAKRGETYGQALTRPAAKMHERQLLRSTYRGLTRLAHD